MCLCVSVSVCVCVCLSVRVCVCLSVLFTYRAAAAMNCSGGATLRVACGTSSFNLKYSEKFP